MPDPATTNQAESPPVKISAGLGTKVGLGAAAAAVLPVLIDFMTDERLAPADRRLLLTLAAALAGLVILSRGAQAVAAEVTRGKRPTAAPAQVFTVPAALTGVTETALAEITQPVDDDRLAVEEGVTDLATDDPDSIPPDQGDPGSQEPPR